MIKSIFYMAITSMLFAGCVGTDSDYNLRVGEKDTTRTIHPAKPVVQQDHQ